MGLPPLLSGAAQLRVIWLSPGPATAMRACGAEGGLTGVVALASLDLGPSPTELTALTTSMTTTISRPTPDAMRATPRRAFTIGSVIDLHRQLWRMMIEILRIVRDPKTRSEEH